MGVGGSGTFVLNAWACPASGSPTETYTLSPTRTPSPSPTATPSATISATATATPGCSLLGDVSDGPGTDSTTYRVQAVPLTLAYDAHISNVQVRISGTAAGNMIGAVYLNAGGAPGALLDMTYDSFGDASADGISLIEIFNGLTVPEPFDYGGSLTLDPLSANYTLSLLDGRVIVVNPNASGRKLILPNPANCPLGGPHFYVVNLSGSNSVSIEYPLATPVVTLAASSSRTLHVAKNGSGVPTWYYT
jgi:hypothetical protein